jgi:hypothetical protein
MKLWISGMGEGGRNKTHIIAENSINPLCGVLANKYSSETLEEATEQWISQPDPDNQLCKNCKRVALRLLTPKL